MKKLTLILLFSTLFFGHAQIDYKGLIRNLEEVTVETDLKTYFKGLPIDDNYGYIEFNDERFLRFYGVIVNKVIFSKDWRGKTMNITFFDEKEDYEKIKAKLTEIHGEPELQDHRSITQYRWGTDGQIITLKIEFEESEEKENEEIVTSKFKRFDEFYINFNE